MTTNPETRRAAEMSVVIVTPDRYETVRKTIGHLRTQTVRDRLEIVIVVPSAKKLELDVSELQPFFAARVAEVGNVKSLGQGNATGVRIASAPIVAMLEDHSYPAPKWAEFILEAHKEPWAAVGPTIGNPNPRGAVSCVDFLLGFGTWSIPTPSQAIDHLPTHNSSYKTKLLLEYGSELEAMLKSEIVLNWHLKSKGHQLYLESRAKVYHRNFELLSSLLRVQFYSGRVFAGIRSGKWQLVRRLVYTCGAPLIPLKRLRYVLRQLRSRGQRKQMPRWFFPTLLLALMSSAVGEMCGFAVGVGNASAKLCEFEFHRERHARSTGRIHGGGGN
jgi:hypothetical protein